MWSPSPTPLVFISFEESRNPKSLNSLSWSSSLIPMPESMTFIWTIPCPFEDWKNGICFSLWRSSFSLMNLHSIVTEPPCWVNFIAFDNRLSIICWILWMCELMLKTSSSKFYMTNLRLTPQNSAFMSWILTISEIASHRLNLVIHFRRTPELI